MHITHKLIWGIWNWWHAWYTYTQTHTTYTSAERMQLLSSVLSICISIAFIRFTTAYFAAILTTHETREKSLERERKCWKSMLKRDEVDVNIQSILEHIFFKLVYVEHTLASGAHCCITRRSSLFYEHCLCVYAIIETNYDIAWIDHGCCCCFHCHWEPYVEVYSFNRINWKWTFAFAI